MTIWIDEEKYIYFYYFGFLLFPDIYKFRIRELSIEMEFSFFFFFSMEEIFITVLNCLNYFYGAKYDFI